MTDAPQHNSKKGRTVSPEVFAKFLECLSSDSEEAGRRYMRLHQKLIAFFTARGISDPLNAADETIDRATLKINEGALVPDVSNYCLGIARYITKERLRLSQRESLAFINFTEDLADASNDQVQRIYDILKPCFEQLAVEEQQLLIAYCKDIRGRARAEHRRQLAESMQMTMLALRMRVTRLRANLTDCVKKSSNDE
jgi:hypothetical protein